MTPFRAGRLVCGLVVSAAAAAGHAQATLPADSVLVRALTFRSIGPAVMSGRITDLAVAENPAPARGGRVGTVVYVGAATGGIWKTTNAGVTWAPVFDSVGTGGIGAVEVAPSNSDIVWVGTGEASNMRSSSWGTGVYKSTDGGRTWSAAMLPTSQHIGRIVIDPRDPNVVYVAALGPLWAPGGERGLFKTADGGRTWVNTKEISPHTGFTDIAMDPNDPDVLYAASFERERREYGFLPAGPESGIWKSVDGAKSWSRLTRGLPAGDIGRIGLSVCASKPRTVYASIHAKGNTGGIFRTDDAGATWRQVSPTNGTAWYYSFVKCDPTDPEHVVRLNANSQESRDGGRTWTAFAGGNGIHTDHHELWIDPANPDLMMLGTDGGLYTTYDAGRTWDHNEALPFSQFYDVFVDDALPYYHVCGGLQDNGAWCGPSRTRNAFGPTNADWYRTAGGDGFYAVPDPTDDNFVYAESQGGGVVRYDARTGQSRGIRPNPPPGAKPYRFNWNAPILPSRHTPKVVYMAANFLFRSTDRGDTWTTISPDLTRAIDRKTLPMRGAVPDSTTLGLNEGTAEFSNITTIDESAFTPTLLAVGTDDGIVQVTRDGGRTWTKTDHFDGIPDTTYVSRVSWSRAAAGTLYATLDGHRSNDFRPYVVKSTDYGATWTNITGNLPAGSVQVIREHPRTPQLLFVGTEFGVFVSTEGGTTWTAMRGGFPAVPVDDIKIQERWNDLVVGTHGRGAYILDDVTPLERLADAKRQAATVMFPIADALLYQPNASRGSGMGTRGFSGENPPPGPKITYLLRNADTSAKAKIDIVDATGTVVRELAVPGAT
ncbi:MAG TPA: hypothetical protein VG916_02340, partial [Gemmatimonadaceae bacterium]|nr:hypothetical protein [Gemmatimonadaceae bacterium]